MTHSDKISGLGRTVRATTGMKKNMGTVALIIRNSGPGDESPELLEALSDDQEIDLLEEALQRGEKAPLEVIHERRVRIAEEDERFGDYVEELLSRPFIRPEIQRHGLQWLRSKLKIEQFQQSEDEATQVIAEYAYEVYKEDPSRTEFVLAGPKAQVRIRIFAVDELDGQGGRDRGGNGKAA